MSTVSSSFSHNSRDKLTHQTGSSDTEKLKRRREARNKRILNSGTARLNRIIGLTSNNHLSSPYNEDGFKANETEAQIKANSTNKVSSDSKNVLSEGESKDDTPEVELNSTSALKGGVTKSSEGQQKATPCLPIIDSDSFLRSGNPLVDAFLKTCSEDKSERLASEEVSQSQSQQEFDLNEIMESVLPHFLAQPAANAFLTHKEGEPDAPLAVKGNSKGSIWSPDGRVVSLLRFAALTILILSLLIFGAIQKAGAERESYESERGTLIELPLLGALKPYHVLLSVEIALQTHRYIFLQGTRRPASQGVPSTILQVYELFKFYSASWASLVDDLCLVVFLLGLWALVEPYILPLAMSL